MSRDAIDERISAGAKAIASDLQGPAGQIPLDRIVIHHLAWFDLCQQRGMTWSQMARALRSGGAGRAGGFPFTPGHLSSVVWRQRQKGRDGQGASTPLLPVPPVAAAPAQAGLQQTPRRQRTSGLSPRPPAGPSVPIDRPAEAHIAPPPSSSSPDPGEPDLRGIMRRAARLRNQRFDDEE